MSKLTIVKIENALVNVHIANLNLQMAEVDKAQETLGHIERILVSILEDAVEASSSANQALAKVRAQFEPIGQ